MIYTLKVDSILLLFHQFRLPSLNLIINEPSSKKLTSPDRMMTKCYLLARREVNHE